MEGLQPEDIEDLLQELEEEYGAQESLPQEVEELLHVLQSRSRHLDRLDAAERLGNVEVSNPRIVRALIAAYESDPYAMINRAAAKSLRAPVHQAYLQQHPDLMQAVETARQQRSGADRQVLRTGEIAGKATERAAARPPSPPTHFLVETEGDTLCISWQPDPEQRRGAVKAPLFLLSVSVVLLLFVGAIPLGGARSVYISVLSVAALGGGYWIAALWVNSTSIHAGKEKWIVQRGPLPLHTQQFYFRPRRVDPAACRRVWTGQTERYKLKLRGSSASGGSTEGVLGCLLLLVEIGFLLSSAERELVTTYTLYAQCVDGRDRKLLQTSLKWEVEYLEYALQNQLDAGGGLPAQD